MKIKFIILVWFLGSQLVFGQSLDQQVSKMAQEICEQMKIRNIKTIAVSIPKFKGQETEFGELFAEKLSGKLALSCNNLIIVNQTKLTFLLDQNKLTAEGLLNQETDAAKLGLATGIDAIVFGIVSLIGESLDINLNVIELKTTNLVGNSSNQLSLTNSLMELLQTNTSPNKPKKSVSDSDCETKRTCMVCIQNNLQIELEVRTSYKKFMPDKLIVANQTECWKNISVNPNLDFQEAILSYFREGVRFKTDRILISPCKEITKIVDP